MNAPHPVRSLSDLGVLCGKKQFGGRPLGG